MVTQKVGTIEEVGQHRWDSFIASHPYSSIYHTRAWHRVIEHTYHYKAFYHVVLDEKRNIRSGFPCTLVRNLFLGSRMVVFPYSDHCDPLLGHPSDGTTLIESVKAKAENQRVQNLEVRAYQADLNISGAQTDNSFCNFVLRLDRSLEDLYKSFHKTCVQRALRRATERGVQVSEGETLTHLREFYKLHVVTRRKLGVPAQPFHFFENLWNEFYAPGDLTLLLARNLERTLAALIVLRFKDNTYYKFGASDPKFLHLNPNQLLFWTAIQEAVRRGHQYFEFGRTAKSNTGLMEFKRRWGAVAEDLHYTALTPSGKTFNSAECGIPANLGGHLLRTMPNVVTRVLGSLIYRYLG